MTYFDNYFIIDGRVNPEEMIFISEGKKADNTLVITNSSSGEINGTSGNDMLEGTSGDDVINGLDGDDIILGNGGNDTLNAGFGSDILFGGDGNDTLIATGNNNDFFGNNNEFYGGAGNDTIIFGLSFAASGQIFSGGSGYDILDLSQLNIGYSHTQSEFDDTIIGIEEIIGNEFRNLLIFSDSVDAITLDGRGGDDSLSGGSGNDVLLGGSDNDSLRGNAGNDFISGGAGDDRVFGGTGSDTLLGGTGVDELVFNGAGSVTVNLLTGEASGGDAQGDVFSGFENVTGSFLGDDTLTGDNSNNVIDGNLGNDTLRGLGGDDLIIGRGGSDTIIIDQNGGTDTIEDFEVGVDIINVSAFEQLEVQNGLSAYQDGFTTNLVLSNNTEINFTGIDIQNLSLSDFDFTPHSDTGIIRTPPNDELIEYFARIVAYDVDETGVDPKHDNLSSIGIVDGELVTFEAGVVDGLGDSTGYTVDAVFNGLGGFIAVGLISETGEPVLAIRGSNSGADWLDNFNPNGVGVSQFLTAWNAPDNALQNWVNTQAPNGLHVTGHSLGGAQAQLLAAYASSASTPASIRSLTTFNSPGISDEDLNRVDYLNIGSVEHHISTGDIVSLAGDGFVEGNVTLYNLDTVIPTSTLSALSHAFFSHARHWSSADLYNSNFDNDDAIENRTNDPFIVNQTITTDQLSAGTYSPLISNFGFDIEYFEFLLALNKVAGPVVPVILLSRAGAEAGRSSLFPLLSTIYEGVFDIVDGFISIGQSIIDSLLDGAETFSAAANAVGNWTASQTNLIVNWTEDTFDAIGQFTSDIWEVATDWGFDTVAAISSWTAEQWDNVRNWTAAAWEGVQNWTSQTWVDAQNWSQEIWDTLSDWTESQWMEIQDWTSTQIDRILNLSSDVLQTTISEGAAFLRDIRDLDISTITDIVQSITSPIVQIGTAIVDNIVGGVISEIFDLGIGDDTVSPGGGFDDVTLGAGADRINGTQTELDGLQVTDFTDEDALQINNANFDLEDIIFTRGSAILDIDTDGDGVVDTTIMFAGEFDLDEFIVTQVDGNTVITTMGSSVGFSQQGTDEIDDISGSPGDDLLGGGLSDDILSGNNGNDTLIGGLGNDMLNGGLGVDTVDGSGRTENWVVNLGSGVALITGVESNSLSSIENFLGGSGDDRVFGSIEDNELIGNDGEDLLAGLDGADTLDGGLGDDSLAGGNGNDTLIGGDGNDRLFGNNDNDTIFGGAGNDFTNGGNGDDVIFGGDDDDTILVGGAGNDEIHGEAGNDAINGSAGDDELFGEEGNDNLFGGDGEDTLNGGSGNDTLGGLGDNDLIIGGAGDDGINGGGGDDNLFGFAGEDRLFGGTGDDVLNGGTGDDLLVGQSGVDRFVFSNDWGHDQISGYGTVATGAPRQDETIDLSSLLDSGGNAVDFADLTFTQSGNNTIITVDGHDGNSIEVLFRTVAEFTVDDFAFG